MLDSRGYRLNVGIIIANDIGDVLWAHRVRAGGWQFPQGGMHEGETPEQSMYRELREEVGLSDNSIEGLGVTRGWLRYRLPERMIRPTSSGVTCIGQKQKWYLLRLADEESRINLNATDSPEFDRWQWVSYWYPVNQIIDFKRWVYQRALKELSPIHYNKLRYQANRER